MRIMLVQPSSPIIEKTPSLGLGYIGARLSEHGHAVRIVHAGINGVNLKNLVSMTADFNPQLLGIQSFTFFHDIVLNYAKLVKKALPNVTIALGGPHPSGLRGRVISGAPCFDYAFHGESEIGVAQLAGIIGSGDESCLDSVSGLIWRKGETIQVNAVGQIENLDSIPFPLWEQLDPLKYRKSATGFFAPALPIVPFITSRGCDRKCTFCQNVIKGLRWRSVENCVEELDFLWNRFSIAAFSLVDQNFAFSEDRVAEFCEALMRTGRNYKWHCPNGVRLDSLTPRIVSSMRAAGCHSIAVGIESVSPDVLKNMNKDLSLDSIREGLSMIRTSGIRVTGNFIFGFPGEKPRDIKNSIRFAVSSGIDWAFFASFVPFPGTKYFEAITAGTDINAIRWSSYDVYSTRLAMTMHPVMLRLYLTFAYLLFYARPRTLVLSLKSTPFKRYLHLIKRVARILTYG